MNNRQPNRRRGRGNNRAQQQNRGGGDYQNRIDNRARGNAAQMLEKYKKLANDAQLNGDRVQAEYYHQFADHYFRVLADAKARQEEQQAARQARWQERRGSDEGYYGDEGDRDTTEGSYDPYASQHHATATDNDGDGQGNADTDFSSDENDAPRRQQRDTGRGQNRGQNRDRGPREPRSYDRQYDDRPTQGRRAGADDAAPESNAELTQGDEMASPARAPRATKRPGRRPRAESGDDAPATLDLAALPPAIGGGEEDAPVKKPRATRRPRKAEDTVEAAE